MINAVESLTRETQRRQRIVLFQRFSQIDTKTWIASRTEAGAAASPVSGTLRCPKTCSRIDKFQFSNILEEICCLETEHKRIVLLYAAKDEKYSNAIVLKAVLGGKEVISPLRRIFFPLWRDDTRSRYENSFYVYIGRYNN